MLLRGLDIKKVQGLAQCLAHRTSSVAVALVFLNLLPKVLFPSISFPESDFIFQQRDIKISEVLNNHI